MKRTFQSIVFMLITVPIVHVFLLIETNSNESQKQITVYPLPIAGPLHLQGCRADSNSEHPLTITFDRAGARMTFYLLDIPETAPSYFQYKIKVVHGAAKLFFHSIEQVINQEKNQNWFPLSGSESVKRLTIMALKDPTVLQLDQFEAWSWNPTLNTSTTTFLNVELPFPNADFELGNLDHWTVEGDAFQHQPTYQDHRSLQAPEFRAFPAGDYWIGTFEKRPGILTRPGSVQGDEPVGVLTSEPFQVNHRFLTGLVGGGYNRDCGVSIHIEGKEIARFTGSDQETLQPFILDVSEYKGLQCKIQVIDQVSSGWGHVNADDFYVFGSFPMQ